jgi:hypothetical protein
MKNVTTTTARFLPTVIFIASLVVSCSDKQPADSLFTKLSPSETGIAFSNTISYNEEFNPYTFRNFFNGAGVAIGDINNDGLQDIYFCSNQQSGKLYLNKGNFKFEDITEQSGINADGVWCTGVSFADINGDGLIDIYICKSGDINSANRSNSLYINKTKNGIISFEEKAGIYGLDHKGLSTHAAFFDYDNDGDLDCYLLTNSFRSVSNYTLIKDQRNVPDSLGGNRLFRNDADHFTDVTNAAGIYSSMIGFGLGVTISDIDKDGWQDIYVSNDFFERDYVYLNQGTGKFIESAEDMLSEMSLNSMGADIADINNDGYSEIYVTDMLPQSEARLKTKTSFEDWDKYQSNIRNGYYRQFARNTLQLNNRVKHRTDPGKRSISFSEVGRFAGVSATDWSWGALITDLDNNGHKDIFVANGIYKDITDQDYIQYTNGAYTDIRNQIVNKERNIITRLIDQIPSEPLSNYAFSNNGNLTFTNKAASWGLDEPSFSNGSAYGDLDNDGDLDLVINNVNMPAFIYRNETNFKIPGNNYLKIILRGDLKNKFGIGAKITIFYPGGLLFQEQMPMRGFQSSVDHRPNFGLGKINEIDSVTVEWPGGKYSVIKNAAVNKQVEIVQADGVSFDSYENIDDGQPYFKDPASNFGIEFVHHENQFSDFDRDRLIFQMMSRQGPHLAPGDINKDGLEDFYVCAPSGQTGVLYKQTEVGKFIPTNHRLFQNDSLSEDTDALFFDADNDGDEDLFVCSGGNEFSPNSTALISRLYLNDGKGNFSKSSQILPAYIFESSSCVRAADIDGDKDLDLFVGVRLKPFSYGYPCKSYILQNDGHGMFSDITEKVAPGLMSAGMVTDAQWFDYNKDGRPDLAITGEYMPITLYQNTNGHFREVTAAAGLEGTNGWWNRLLVTDLNGDGYTDIVGANHGLNSKFKATSKKPLNMYVGDFDKNGMSEPVLTGYNGDSSYPFLLKHDLLGVLPYLKNKYLKYDTYKEQTIENIFNQEQLSAAKKLSACYMQSAVFLNNRDGKFTAIALPMEAQFSSMFSILSHDFDEDGNTDLLLAGNFYESKPEAGIYTASLGCFLRGKGDGNFEYLSPEQSGLQINGAIRDMILIRHQKERLLIIGKNDDLLQVKKVGRLKNDIQ